MVPAQSHKLYDASSSLAPATMADRYVVKKALWDWGIWDTQDNKWVIRGNLEHNEAKERVKKLNA